VLEMQSALRNFAVGVAAVVAAAAMGTIVHAQDAAEWV
jgi:hypothetical protein